MNLLKRYPIIAFFVLAFVLAWSIRIGMNITSIDAAPLKLLAEFGPAIAALIVTAAVNGKAGVRTLLGRVLKWRANPWWYVLVLFGPTALQLLSIGTFVLPILLTIGFILSMGEEIGWRGFAYRDCSLTQTQRLPASSSVSFGRSGMSQVILQS